MGKVYYLFRAFYKGEGKAQGDVSKTACVTQSQDLNSLYSKIHALNTHPTLSPKTCPDGNL